jgi:hypothetical protein
MYASAPDAAWDPAKTGERIVIERTTHYPGGLMLVMYERPAGTKHHVFAMPGKNTELGYVARSGNCFECKTRDCEGVTFALAMLDREGYADEEKKSFYNRERR